MTRYARRPDLARIESEICYIQKELVQRSKVGWTLGGSTRSEELNARREELEIERRAIKAQLHEEEAA